MPNDRGDNGEDGDDGDVGEDGDDTPAAICLHICRGSWSINRKVTSRSSSATPIPPECVTTVWTGAKLGSSSDSGIQFALLVAQCGEPPRGNLPQQSALLGVSAAQLAVRDGGIVCQWQIT